VSLHPVEVNVIKGISTMVVAEYTQKMAQNKEGNRLCIMARKQFSPPAFGPLIIKIPIYF
jgi:hypothetical protein